MKQNEQSIGMYGKMWMQHMEKNYPQKVKNMKNDGIYYSVACSVDMRAAEYWEQLSHQYDKRVPRPRNKKFEIDHLVMTEIVLVPVTTP